MSQCDQRDDCAFAEKFERSMSELTHNIEVLSRKLDELNHHITGNGTPENGVMFRQSWTEKKLKSMERAVGVIAASFATLVGSIIVIAIVRAIESGAK